jgi:hypothetical protein
MSDVHSDWQDDINELRGQNSDPHLDDHFGRDTDGSHELADRATLLLNNWSDYVLDHPSCILNFELYQRATEIMNLMCDFYQAASENDYPPETEIELDKEDEKFVDELKEMIE